MKIKTGAPAVAVLLLTGGMIGQMPNPSAGSQTKSQAQTTVTGCLHQSAGNYTLTDQSGNTIQLQGDTSQLAKHVGEEVKIKGTSTPSMASSSTTPSARGEAGAGSGNNEAQTNALTVASINRVSNTCTSSATNPR